MFDWMGGAGGMPNFGGGIGFADLQNMPGLMQDGGGGLIADGNGGLRPTTGNDYFAGAVGKALGDLGLGQKPDAPTDPVLGLPGGQGFRNRQASLADGMTRLGLLSGKIGP